MDLPGINVRYQARLNVNGIHSPLQFLDTPMDILKKQVFHSVVGYYWYMRLRGYEVDHIDYGRKSYGQQYAIGQKTTNRQELSRYLMKLCEKAGRRMRQADYIAGGVHVWLGYENRTYWAKGRKLKTEIYSTQDIFIASQRLLNEATIPCKVTNIGVSVFNLRPYRPEQLGLFDDSRLDTSSLAKASDIINDRYGEFTLVPALMANMQDVILKRVAFGNVD